MTFSYFLNRKRATCVVSFNGMLDEDGVPILNTCLNEVMSDSPKYVVLNFGGLLGVEEKVARPFVIFQQNLRDVGSIYLCNLSGSLEAELKAKGIIRDSEIRHDLMDALQAILRNERPYG